MENRTRSKAPRAGQSSVWLKWLACAFILILSFIIFYAMMLRPASDLSIHAAWAAEGDFLHPRSFVRHHAHPLWHFTDALLLLLGIPEAFAGALSTALWKAAEFLAAYAIIKRVLGKAKPYVAPLCAVCATLVSALCVPWLNPTVYRGVGSPNTWHNPTQLAGMVFMLICVPMVADSYTRFERSLPDADYRMTLREWVTIAAALALSILAKPVFLQAFLPAASLFFLVKWIQHPKGSRYFLQMVAAVLPTLPLFALQFCFYFTNENTDTGMTILLTWDKLRECTITLVLMELFPLFALLTERNQKKNTLLSLTLLFNAVSFLEKLLFSEVGRRAGDGNFGWALLGGALMLWVVMLPRFVRQFSEWRAQKNAGGAWRYWVGFPLLAYHLASGVYYIAYLLTTTNAL